MSLHSAPTASNTYTFEIPSMKTELCLQVLTYVLQQTELPFRFTRKHLYVEAPRDMNYDIFVEMIAAQVISVGHTMHTEDGYIFEPDASLGAQLPAENEGEITFETDKINCAGCVESICAALAELTLDENNDTQDKAQTVLTSYAVFKEQNAVRVRLLPGADPAAAVSVVQSSLLGDGGREKAEIVSANLRAS